MTDHMELVGRLENWPLHKDGADFSCKSIDAQMREAAACIREMVEWRPIEMAPEHGPILVWDEDNLEPVIATLRGQDNSWWIGDWDVLIKTSHWLPLPLAPGAEA